MWKSLAGLLFKILASVGAVFMIRKSGADKQRLKSAEKSLDHARQANEIDEHVDGMSAGDLDRELRRHRRN